MKIDPKNSYIPSEAYLYFPKDTNKENRMQRTIFDGNTEFNSHEKQMIAKFRSFCEKHKYTLKPMWTDNMILRFLYANCVKDHTTWKEKSIPVKIDDALQNLLNSGLLYVHGRDHEFHPIVIFNIYMIDSKNVDIDLITRTLTYGFEFVIDEMMLPGQIENWIFIVDAKGMGVATLALQSIRKLFAYLQDHYKCRLHSLYALNVTSALTVPWKIIKNLLDEVTVKKINFCSGSTPEGLFDSTNPEQIEQKFGGLAPNAMQFWYYSLKLRNYLFRPPCIPSNNYFVSPDDTKHLISKEEYISLYKSGQLNGMRVSRSIVEEESNENIQNDVINPSQVDLDVSMRLNSSEEFNNQPSSLHSLNTDEKKHSSEKINTTAYLHQNSNSKNGESLETDEGSETDYLDYMDEMLKKDEKDIIMREFEASFLRLSHSKNNNIFDD